MNKKTQAKCTGTTLTVGFHGAHPPLIWRFDLERNHSFTLSLQGEEGDWELGVTSPRGDFYGVAHFAAREDGEEALLKVEKVLARRRGGVLWRVLLGVAVAAFVVVALVFIIGGIINHTPQHAMSSAIAPTAAPVMIQPGMPQPADEVLKPPPQ